MGRWSVKWAVKTVESVENRFYSGGCHVSKYCTCHTKGHSTRNGTSPNAAPAAQTNPLTIAHVCHRVCTLSPLDAALTMRPAKARSTTRLKCCACNATCMSSSENDAERLLTLNETCWNVTNCHAGTQNDPATSSETAACPTGTATPQQNQRNETRHVGGSKQAFRTRLSQNLSKFQSQICSYNFPHEPQSLPPQSRCFVQGFRQFPSHVTKPHACHRICTLPPLDAALTLRPAKTRSTTRLKCCPCHAK